MKHAISLVSLLFSLMLSLENTVIFRRDFYGDVFIEIQREENAVG